MAAAEELGTSWRPRTASPCGRSCPRPSTRSALSGSSGPSGAATLLPEAVVEIISPGSEVKGLQLAPPFYLGQGVKDVIVLDPRSQTVAHHRREGVWCYVSPVEIELEMGCMLTV
jgi:hypothetical protein